MIAEAGRPNPSQKSDGRAKPPQVAQLFRMRQRVIPAERPLRRSNYRRITAEITNFSRGGSNRSCASPGRGISEPGGPPNKGSCALVPLFHNGTLPAFHYRKNITAGPAFLPTSGRSYLMRLFNVCLAMANLKLGETY